MSSNIVLLVVMCGLGAYEILIGLAALFTHKVYGMGKSAEKYTDESLRVYSPWQGLSNVLLGTGLILSDVWKTPLVTIGGTDGYPITCGVAALLGLAVIGITILAVGYKKLVKK